jgi:hypothetical protein
LLALLVLGIGLGVLVSGAASADDDAGRIDKLVKQLGSKRFAERDRAKRDLEAIGTAALDALRVAARSKDLETSRRAGELVKKMEEKIALDNLLAPKRVRLKLKDTPVTQAVADLAKQSGYNLLILGDRAALANRKITLDTGDTTFWQALDQLCAKAGLVENTTNAYTPNGINPYGVELHIQQLPQVQILPVVPPMPAPPAPPILNPGVQLRNGGKVGIAVQVEVKAAPAAAPAQAQPAPAKAVRPVPAQPAPAVQPPPVQVKPAPLVPVQVQPGVIIRRQVGQPYNPNQITLVAGKPQQVPTSYAGAVRVRVVPAAPQQPGVPAPQAGKRDGEAQIHFQVSAEPRVQNFQLMGDVQIDKAVDDQGQQLSVPMEPMPVANPAVERLGGLRVQTYYNPYSPQGLFHRYTSVRLKRGEKPAKTLKELSGHLTAQMLSPLEPVITVENVLKAGGKKVEGKGGTLTVQSVEKQADGTYRVQFHMQLAPGFIQAPFQGPVAPALAMPPNGPAVGGIQPLPAGGRLIRRPVHFNTHGLPALVDAKGKVYQLTQNPQRIYRANFGGGLSQDVTMIFRAHEGQGEPARLVLQGQRNISVQIPFRLENVSLP